MYNCLFAFSNWSSSTVSNGVGAGTSSSSSSHHLRTNGQKAITSIAPIPIPASISQGNIEHIVIYGWCLEVFQKMFVYIRENFNFLIKFI